MINLKWLALLAIFILLLGCSQNPQTQTRPIFNAPPELSRCVALQESIGIHRGVGSCEAFFSNPESSLVITQNNSICRIYNCVVSAAVEYNDSNLCQFAPKFDTIPIKGGVMYATYDDKTCLRDYHSWFGASAVVYYNLTQQAIEHGSFQFFRDNYGRNPLHQTFIFNKLMDAKRLIDAGADVNDRDYEGATPLMLFTQMHNPVTQNDLMSREFMRLAIDDGADVNAKDNKGKTALMYLMGQRTSQYYNATIGRFVDDYTKKIELADLLLENGADINTVDNDGYSALSYAAYFSINGKEDNELTDYLISRGADASLKNKLINEKS